MWEVYSAYTCEVSNFPINVKIAAVRHDVCLSSTGTGNSTKQSKEKKQRKRTEKKRQVQERDAGELVNVSCSRK